MSCFARASVRLLTMLLLAVTIGASAGTPPPMVVSTIRPLHLIVLALAADQVDAREFPGIGASVHDFVLRPSAIQLLKSARLVLWIGPDLERPLEGLLERIPGLHDVALLPRLPQRELLPGADPHVWLDPRLARSLAHEIAAALSASAALDEARLRARLDAFDAAMQTVEQQMRNELHGLEKVPFMVMHDGYGYYVRRFGLAQVLALGPDAEHFPGARALSGMRAAALGSGARCLLREENSSARLVSTLTEGTALVARDVDPLALSAAPGENGFVQFLGDFTRSVAGCLRGPAS